VSLATVRPEAISMLNVLPGTLKAFGESAGASVDVQIDVAGTILLARITRKSVEALELAPGRPVFALVKAVAIDRHSVGWV
ncbi:MAG: TOBE domain-containing protein, partial [Burkholderiales bacterium]